MCIIYISFINLLDVIYVRGGEYLEFKICLFLVEFIFYVCVVLDFLKYFINLDFFIYLYCYV